MTEFINMNGKLCECGKVHSFDVHKIFSGKGAVKNVPDAVTEYGAKKVFVFSDINTYEAAGKTVCGLLDGANIPYINYVINKDTLEPDEECVGSVIMHFDASCDFIIAVGSGVINDTGKILSTVSGKPYMIVGTAPSMDGYASSSSSMNRDGLKISLSSRSPDVIIGDTDIMKNAPTRMLRAGLGDMLAKYVSICEWRISNLINGEYYCEKIAGLVRKALKKCIDNAEGLLRRDDAAVESVFEGLVICGAAMNYAGISRPASGCEHYFSHVWDMRAVEFGTKEELHGIQCAIGTLMAARLYEKLKNVTPDRKKALEYVKNFDKEEWNESLRAFLGKGAESMIALEAKEGKYDAEKHAKRLETIIENWENILGIIDEEIPASSEIEKILDTIGAPKSVTEIGIEESVLPMTVKAAKDIRDKYVLPRLLWDLGVLDEFAKF